MNGHYLHSLSSTQPFFSRISSSWHGKIGLLLPTLRPPLSLNGSRILSSTAICCGLLSLLSACGGGATSNNNNSNLTDPQSNSDYTTQAVSTWIPSLGINGEEPQPESDTVGGQPLPFADVFRVARPFNEYSCGYINYDAKGWPLSIPVECSTASNPFLRTATSAALRNAPVGAIPEGQYKVFFDGQGSLTFSGIANYQIVAMSGSSITVKVTGNTPTNISSGLRFQITQTNPSNPLKNIRIVMPGGICTSKPTVRVTGSSNCPLGDYKDFALTLQQNRNAIVFNPDYLNALKDFKVLRTMNLMKVSPRKFCTGTGQAYLDCLFKPFTWEQRAKMDDAVWGGSGFTALAQRYGRGVPPEVLIELANTLNIEPWFNMPHSADDNYVQQFATLVRDKLKPNLRSYLEYSNETWNGIFEAAEYVRKKGVQLQLRMMLGSAWIGWSATPGVTNESWTGAFYTARRSREIFQIWQTTFGSTTRFKRILGSYYANEYLTRNMLDFETTKSVVDAVAVAPYFQACWTRTTHLNCASKNTTTQAYLVDRTIEELALSSQTLADKVTNLFAMMNDSDDPYGIDSIIKAIQAQKAMVNKYNIPLYAYEGGQHLIVDWNNTKLSSVQKENLRLVLEAANRDARMGSLYTKLLTNWKAAGGQLFVLYTLPQSYHQWGSWGIKETLTASRVNSPKYDAIMKFQETVLKPWW